MTPRRRTRTGTRKGPTDSERLGARANYFAVTVRDLDSMTALSRHLLETVAPLDVSAAASGVVSGPKAASANPFHFAAWPKVWLDHYVTNNFLLIDPVPRWARNSGAAATWREVTETLRPRDPGRAVFEAARRFGFEEGMVLPMRSWDNSVGLLAFAGSRPTFTPSEQAFLAAVGRAAFEAAERIERGGKAGRPAPILSAREIECITLLVRGHSDRQIAKLLDLSERTVRFHLDNARNKSGASSRIHLAAISVARGHVTI